MWMIYKHDVNGHDFKNAWSSCDIILIMVGDFEDLVVEGKEVVMEI